MELLSANGKYVYRRYRLELTESIASDAQSKYDANDWVEKMGIVWQSEYCKKFLASALDEQREILS